MEWAAKWSRLIVSKDKTTLISEHDQYVGTGHNTPGLLIVRPGATIPALLESLVLIAHYSDSDEWKNQCRFIPL